MKRRPDQGAEPLPPAPPQEDTAPASPGSTAVQFLLARTLKAVGEQHGDDVIKDAAEQLARAAKDRLSR